MIYEQINASIVTLGKQKQYDAIVHGCNCFCKMGAGVARQIRIHFPQAFEADLQTIPGDKNKLGTYTSAISDYGTTIINAYTQYYYGKRDLICYVNYEAMQAAFELINRDFKGSNIAMPQIGSGLGGGDWNIITTIISESFPDCKITIAIPKKKVHEDISFVYLMKKQ